MTGERLLNLVHEEWGRWKKPYRYCWPEAAKRSLRHRHHTINR